MGPEALLVLALMGAALVPLVTGWLPVAVLTLGMRVVPVGSEILILAREFSGFASDIIVELVPRCWPL